MTCRICNIAGNRELLETIKLYEDEKAVAVLSKKPASMCHVIIFPKNHYTIIEMVPDEDVAHLFDIANKISRAMFESLNIQGTNIFVQNGVSGGQEEPHFSIHIIARVENDGVKLQWEPKKLSEEEMSTIELKYKQFTEGVALGSENATVIKQDNTAIESEEDEEDDDGENYMLRYFNKMP